jgi:hypothetical protein
MEHANEVFPYLLATIGFFAVYVLNGIKSEIREVKETVKSLESDLRGGVSSLDRRVAAIEATCRAYHSQD